MKEVILRPLSVGELLDKAFRIYRMNFLVLIGMAAVVLIPEAVLQTLSVLYFDNATIASLISQAFIHLIAYAAMTVFIAHVHVGREISFRDSYGLGLKRYWSIFGANFLMGLAIGAPMILVMLCSMTVGVLSLVVIMLWLPLAVFLSTRWSLYTPAILAEDIGSSEALKRSWVLTEGYFWRVLGTSFAAGLLAMLITVFPSLISKYVFLSLLSLSYNLVQVINVVIEMAAAMLALPFSIAVIVLIYYDLRVRKEGFDLEVMADTLGSPETSANRKQDSPQT